MYRPSLVVKDYAILALYVLLYAIIVSIPALAIILPWYSLIVYGG